MFGLFKNKKGKNHNKGRQLFDLEDNLLQEGDIVTSLRYELGDCRVIGLEDGGIEYESLESGTKVSWIKMIDAATEKQKVRKKLED